MAEQRDFTAISPATRWFHRTSTTGYEGIRSSGYILPNKGLFPFRYPQTPNYFGYSKGYISLFDFGLARTQDCIATHHTWGQFFFDHKPFTIVLRLNRDILSDKLIPSTAAPKLGDEHYKGRIPFIEAWYPEAIPFATIDSFMVIKLGAERKVLVGEFDKQRIAELENFLAHKG